MPCSVFTSIASNTAEVTSESLHSLFREHAIETDNWANSTEFVKTPVLSGGEVVETGLLVIERKLRDKPT